MYMCVYIFISSFIKCDCVQDPVKYPDSISPNFKSFLKGLLNKVVLHCLLVLTKIMSNAVDNLCECLLFQIALSCWFFEAFK